MTANHRYMSLSSLRRRPVLIAMMVYSVAYGAVTFAVWREATDNSNHRECEKHYLVQSSAESVGGSKTQSLRILKAARHFLI
jgi:hypothetical protein